MTMLGQGELIEQLGIGQLGEVRQGPDGHLYQWVHGMDGLGNPVGFWRGLRRVAQVARQVARTAIPIVQQVAPFVPGGAVVSTTLRAATPVLQRAGFAGVGALYQGPDGSVYAADADHPVHGIGASHLGHDGVGCASCLGTPGEVRTGADGQPYEWVEGIDGLGNPVGLWRAARRAARSAQRVARQAMPLVQQVAPFVPGGAEALRAATPFLQRAGVAADGVGALDADLAEDFDLPAEAGAELDGFGQAYLWDQPALRGLDAYVPTPQPSTPRFVPPAQAPEMWKPLW
jgi:hypothetical protein